MAEYSDGSAPMGMSMPAHIHDGMGAHTAWHDQVHDSLAMTAVHSMAAVLVAVLLHRADSVCWSLARGLTTAVEAVRARAVTAWLLLTERPAPPTAGLPARMHFRSTRPPLKALGRSLGQAPSVPVVGSPSSPAPTTTR